MIIIQKPESTGGNESGEPSMFRIRQITPSDAEALDIIAALHMELLPFGPMAQFGERFIREICYAAPMHDGVEHLALIEIEGQPAGFIAYTDRAQIFHSSVFRKHFIQVGWIVGVSLLQQPRRLLRLPRALRVVLSRDELPDTSKNTEAEVTAFGVRPEFLTPAFVRRTGLRVASLLMDHAFDHFRSVGLSSVRMVVDADNRHALLFYHALGATLTPCIYGGVPSMLVSMDI